jgi:hypothetical protein
VPAWALRVIAVIITGLSMVGSTSYALAHPKNPNAPLQPPVVEPEPGGGGPGLPSEASVPTAPPPFRTLAPTEPPTPSPSPKPTTPAPTARFTAAVTRTSPPPTPTPRATATLRAIPQVTLSAGVRATSLPKVTITHSS